MLVYSAKCLHLEVYNLSLYWCVNSDAVERRETHRRKCLYHRFRVTGTAVPLDPEQPTMEPVDAKRIGARSSPLEKKEQRKTPLSAVRGWQVVWQSLGQCHQTKTNKLLEINCTDLVSQAQTANGAISMRTVSEQLTDPEPDANGAISIRCTFS